MWVKDITVTSAQYDSLLKRITQQIKISFWTVVSLSLSIQERTELRLKYSFFKFQCKATNRQLYQLYQKTTGYKKKQD